MDSSPSGHEAASDNERARGLGKFVSSTFWRLGRAELTGNCKLAPTPLRFL